MRAAQAAPVVLILVALVGVWSLRNSGFNLTVFAAACTVLSLGLSIVAKRLSR